MFPLKTKVRYIYAVFEDSEDSCKSNKVKKMLADCCLPPLDQCRTIKKNCSALVKLKKKETFCY